MIDGESPRDNPVCERDPEYGVAPWGEAFPAPRFVELAYEFGDNGLVASICDDDWSDTVADLARLIQSKL